MAWPQIQPERALCDWDCMTTDLDRADDAAVKLCRVYQAEEAFAIVIRSRTEDEIAEQGVDGVMVVCMAMPPNLVCSLLRRAADQYEARADTVVMN